LLGVGHPHPTGRHPGEENNLRPYVILNAAMTLDGRIATRTGYSSISPREDFERVHTLRRSVDAIMIGSKTLIIDNPRLNVRYVETNGMGKNTDMDKPYKIVVDGKLVTPVGARIFETPGKVIIATTEEASQEKAVLLEDLAVVMRCGSRRVNLPKLLERVYQEYRIRRILLEGGGELNWAMLHQNLVDEIQVYIAPMIFGGRNAVSLVMGEGAVDGENAIKLRLLDVQRLSKGVFLRFGVAKQTSSYAQV